MIVHYDSHVIQCADMKSSLFNGWGIKCKFRIVWTYFCVQSVEL